jgi:hypothetical protein
VASQRAEELRLAIAEWEAAGGSVLIVTLTANHVADDSLEGLLDRLTASMRELWAGGWAKRWRASRGQVGMVRNIEVTWGIANGWHPHAHALLFVGRYDHPTIENLCFYRTPTADEVLEAEFKLKQRWQDVAARHGFEVSLERGATLELVVNGRAASDYMAKDDEKTWGVAEELTWANIKVARGTRFTPFALLAACESSDVGAAPLLFQQYANAFKGRRQLYWSRGLRDLLQLGGEVSDEDAANAQDDSSEFVAVIETSIYCWIKARGFLCDLLEAADEGGGEYIDSFLEWAYDCRAFEARRYSKMAA